MAKKNNINIDIYTAKKIPYSRVYEELGIIETSLHHYTKSYEIGEISADNISEYDETVMRKQMELFLNSFPTDVKYQFTIYNNLIPQEEFCEKVILTPTKKEETLNSAIVNYNSTIVENVNIGHNNVKKNSFLTLSLKADLPEEAITRFQEMDLKIKESFENLYSIKVRELSTVERMKILYSMLNPRKHEFGKKADLDGSGEFSFQNMKYMRMTTKDIVAPNKFDTRDSLKNHLILNDDTYVRAFFLSSVPKVVSDNLISDLTNISSNMIFSIHYEAMDSTYGLESTTEMIKNNTIITTTRNRSTVKDRKNKTVTERRVNKENNEETYMLEAAQEVFKQSVATGYKTMLCSFVIILYAEDLEDLDRDSKLLRISATKFACQVKCLDLQQLQGFQSALPLANCKVNVRRVLDIPKLAIMSPLNVQEAIKENGLFNGLNAINDNLILINRKNSSNMNGLISGVEYSGKTYQCKREILNALMSTNDKVVLITTHPGEYDDFVEKIGGYNVKKFAINAYRTVDHYGIVEEGHIFKSYYLEALIVTANDYSRYLSKDEMKEKIEKVEAEVSSLLKAMSKIGTQDRDKLTSYVFLHEDEYTETITAFNKLSNRYFSSNVSQLPESNGNERFTVYNVEISSDLLVLMDHIWNNVIEDRMKGSSTWIFVDSMDELLKNNHSADYLMEYLEKCKLMKTILTLVAQSTVKLISEDTSSMAFEELVNSLGYFKLLNQGPLERKKYSELLNIPNSLINYITNVEPSEGLILTSATNIAFDDSFVDDDNDPFYSLFRKKVVQYTGQQ